MEPGPTFEEALKRLEEIVRELEGGEIEIEKALGFFEEGTKLSRICAEKLSRVERKVQVLRKNDKEEDVLELFRDMEPE